MVSSFWKKGVCVCSKCGEIFIEYFCKQCKEYQKTYCDRCHENLKREAYRNRDMARLKREKDFV